MGNEASLQNGEPFQDEPNEFHPPTMEENRGAGKVAVVNQQPQAEAPRLGRGALIARLTHRSHQNNAEAAEAATLEADAEANGNGRFEYPGTPPRGAAVQQPQSPYPSQQRLSPEKYNKQQPSQPSHYQQQSRGPPQAPVSHHQAASSATSSATPGGVQVPLMYATEGGSSRGFKRNLKHAQKSGRGLINSMKNLSMKTSALKTTGLKKDQAADWEKQWDEDEESSEDDDDEVDAGPSPQASAYINQPLRPGMDAGHSTFAHSNKALHTAPQTYKKPAGPEMLKPDGAKPKATDPMVKERDLALQAWDKTAPEGTGQGKDAEKPNVEMFLPMLRVLGKGSFGKVVLVQKRQGKERGSLFAMKILRKSHLVKRRQIERTKTERKVLSVVDHPFIMKLHFAFQTDDKLYLVLDYCPGGELFFHLSRFRRFPERVARFYAAELLLAIGHLHKRGIIYRDLKPENVLLDADGHVKLGDFGLAKDNIRHPWEGATSMCGTPEYMAPEVLSQAGHGFCVDYWGLGMLVYEMMTGLPPWYTTDRAKLFRRLKSAPLDIPSYFSTHGASYVSALLERNPRRRLGVAGIRGAMEHDFFRSINWRALYARRVEAPIRPCEGWKPPEAIKKSQTPSDTKGADMSNAAIDVAVANFDNTFTRMPVDTEDGAHDSQQSHDADGAEELNEDTFVGFTFDDYDDNDFVASSPPRATRPRPID